MNLSNKQREILQATGHLLIIGGPGAGKTTISILKAINIANELSDGRKILFLSFARQSVARIVETLEKHAKNNLHDCKNIKIDTYHSFFWKIMKSHGYLLGLPRKLSVLNPPAEAVALSSIRHQYGSISQLTETDINNKNKEESAKRHQIAKNEGRVCFDLFANYVHDILLGSEKIKKLISDTYPYIILDEFQDTSAAQWDVVNLLGQNSELIALADPEQRIYDFIGADPERLTHFIKEFNPSEFNLQDENHRSHGTDILLFGNDILKGKNFRDNYVGVCCKTFEPNKNQAFAALKGQALQSVKRLKSSSNHDWSVAVLVPTKKMMRDVSNYFGSKQNKLPIIPHTASIDMNATLLAAEIFAFFFQPKKADDDQSLFIELVCNFFQGKGSDSPTKKDISESTNIKKAYDKFIQEKKFAKNSILKPMLEGYDSARGISLTGTPKVDWQHISSALEKSGCKRLKQIIEEVKNLKLLRRGVQLRNILSQAWRDRGAYTNALDSFRRFFQKEHFSVSSRSEYGVVIMNMHKSKGKQFDEVIIFEGWPQKKEGKLIGNPDRIVRGNTNSQDLVHYKYMLRVSVTRAMARCTILTPTGDPCILIPNHLLDK
ncbi:MAG: AAA family ATPase [Gammaproteobacteria bacterium CG11_big_fil_rev_8_21_14_0_20_46_22]|nr:MAG: AAA family ATPase [Gammaproteobacteria bacterium CG12_big_fil_rev_8_21_14_0_65_46_12]PIR11057.1 MAG: AAA family ATPase [Gammaproteobacteria bacterium CG11_big_fil_rev_8_21_14_0_20_46_22]